MSKKKIIVLLLIVFALGVASGNTGWHGLLFSWLERETRMAAAPDPKERKVLYWVDPMHPQYKSDKPGTAPDCGMDLVPVYADQQEGFQTAEDLPENALKISTGKQQLMGVRYGTVTRTSMKKTLRATGRIAYDETKIARIHPKIEGWIEKVYVDFSGKLVKKNQPLVDIYSPELVSTQQEFLLAARTRDSLASSPFKEISWGAHSLYQSSRKRLLLWDIDERTIDQIEKTSEVKKALTLYSPNEGFVLERNAYERQRVTPDTELYAVADLANVWILADVYEYEAPLIRIGQSALIELSYYPEKRFGGVVDYIYPELNAPTRTLKVRIQVRNRDYLLKPDMYANVTFNISYGNQVAVPIEAVLDSGVEQTVFIAHKSGFFEPRQIKTGAEVDGYYIVLEGLKPGERVVTSANFLIDSESRLKSALGAMAGESKHQHD